MTQEDLHRQYEETFGVSEDTLRQEGIDPGEYARTKLHLALKGKAVLPRLAGTDLQPLRDRWLYFRWVQRGFVKLFIGFGFLILSTVHPVHWPGLVGACAAVCVALYMVTVSFRYRRRYVAACRQAGTKPRWR
jgi:hypothetical protein